MGVLLFIRPAIYLSFNSSIHPFNQPSNFSPIPHPKSTTHPPPIHLYTHRQINIYLSVHPLNEPNIHLYTHPSSLVHLFRQEANVPPVWFATAKLFQSYKRLFCFSPIHRPCRSSHHPAWVVHGSKSSAWGNSKCLCTIPEVEVKQSRGRHGELVIRACWSCWSCFDGALLSQWPAAPPPLLSAFPRKPLRWNSSGLNWAPKMLMQRPIPARRADIQMYKVVWATIWIDSRLHLTSDLLFASIGKSMKKEIFGFYNQITFTKK